MSIPTPAPTKSHIRRQRLLAALDRPAPSPSTQLDFFNAFATAMPAKFAPVFELFDAAPKFLAGAVTSNNPGEPLQITHRVFSWHSGTYSAEIAPTVIASKGTKGEAIRKEVLPGEREECIWLVLRKMATEANTKRQASESGLSFTCTISQIRRHLEEIHRGWRTWEIREALEVLHRTPLKIRNADNGKILFSGSYITLEYIGDSNDDTGERTTCRITLNKIAARALCLGLYDSINYERVAGLTSALSRWIYERIVLNFRQAGGDNGYTLSLSLIVREGPMKQRARLRTAVEEVRACLQEIASCSRDTSGPILNPLRPFTEELIHEEKSGRGRRPIADVKWTLFPADAVVAEIRASNAAKSQREERLTITTQ